MEPKLNKVTIVGMGALGVLFGELLEKALGPDAVTFAADPARIARYRKEGVFCNGNPCVFRYADNSGDVSPADLVLFAVKATALEEAIEIARPHVGENTILLSILNGISSEEIIGAALGAEHVLFCVAQGMDAVKLGNHLTYSHGGQLCIGVPADQPEKLPLLRQVAQLLEKARIPYQIETDILHRLWSKWMLNVGVNQVCMAEEGTYGTVQREGPARERMKSAMREVIELAELEHVAVTEADLAFYVNLVDTLDPDGMPSMRQDGLAHRYSEVELFSGTVLKKANAHGLSVPVNEALYRQIKEMEARY